MKYAYVCVHMNLRVIRFYMQMPCEYWCFLVDYPDYLIISTLGVFLFLVQLVKFLLFSHPVLPVPRFLRPHCSEIKNFSVFLQDSSFSQSILNP